MLQPINKKGLRQCVKLQIWVVVIVIVQGDKKIPSYFVGFAQYFVGVAQQSISTKYTYSIWSISSAPTQSVNTSIQKEEKYWTYQIYQQTVW